MDEAWEHLQQIARNMTRDYPDAVFIGGVAVSAHAARLGTQYQESSHDADLYLSLQGKAALRDRYEVRRNHNLGKDSALIEGEDIDLYVEHQHPLGVPYAGVFAFSEEVEGIRVAALEHLLVLKLDAAKGRWGSGKGEKDVRDLARIVALIGRPREKMLEPYMTEARRETLARALRNGDIPRLLGLNPHDGSKFRKKLDANLEFVLAVGRPPAAPPSKPANPGVSQAPSPKRRR